MIEEIGKLICTDEPVIAVETRLNLLKESTDQWVKWVLQSQKPCEHNPTKTHMVFIPAKK